MTATTDGDESKKLMKIEETKQLSNFYHTETRNLQENIIHVSSVYTQVTSSVSSFPPSSINSSTTYWQDLEVYTPASNKHSLKIVSTWYYNMNYYYHYNPRTNGRYRKQRSETISKFCSFCYNNQEKESMYTSHDLRDRAKNITCPVLFDVVCRHCGATGTEAHTPKYCPYKS